MKKRILVNEKEGRVLIGYQDDNVAYEYGFRISEFYEKFGPGGRFSIRFSRPKDWSPERGAPYYISPSNFYVEDDILYFSPNDTDTQYDGYGHIQIEYNFENDTQRAMGKNYLALLSKSLSPLTDPPEVWEDYLDWIREAGEYARELLERLEGMTATASVDNTVGTPEVVVTKTEDPLNLDFAFKHIKGETGEVPDIKIGEVETLEPGSAATASITGTQLEPHLNLGIPQGIKGDKGNVMYATFYIDSDMKLHMVTPDEYTGPTFRLNDNKLEVVL